MMLMGTHRSIPVSMVSAHEAWRDLISLLTYRVERAACRRRISRAHRQLGCLSKISWRRPFTAASSSRYAVVDEADQLLDSLPIISELLQIGISTFCPAEALTMPSIHDEAKPTSAVSTAFHIRLPHRKTRRTSSPHEDEGPSAKRTPEASGRPGGLYNLEDTGRFPNSGAFLKNAAASTGNECPE
jgi:hypothetical protein